MFTPHNPEKPLNENRPAPGEGFAPGAGPGEPAGGEASESGEAPPEGEEGGSSVRKRPQAVVRRLSLYARLLYSLEKNGVEKVSSRDLGERLGLNSAQVRKDLASFGQFGVPGYGYNVSELRENIRRALGADREVRLALAGAGNLGQALLSYKGFQGANCRLVAAFDSDKRKIGTRKAGVLIEDSDDMERRLAELAVDIVILAVPPEAAQKAADAAARAGVSAILNFVPARLIVPESLIVQDVDLTLEIESLAYYLNLK